MDAGKGRSGRHPLPWLNAMATEPFYLLHLLAFSSYFAARAAAAPDLSGSLLRREIQALLAFSVLAAVKMVKVETWEALMADILFYAKGFLFLVALFLDRHLAICYLLAFLVIFVLSQQPPYDGVGDSMQLTPLNLETLLTEGNSTRFVLVEFRALYSSRCIRASRMVPDLSTIYSNKNISFGIVDLGHFPNAAERFGISLGDTGQLPTYILFENAVEVARFPDVTTGPSASKANITKGFLCRYFELDKHLIAYVSGK